MYWMGVFLAALGSVLTPVAGEVVQWTDEQSQLHVSDSMASVPPLHRAQAKLKMFRDEAAPRSVLPETARSMPEVSGETQRSLAMRCRLKRMKETRAGQCVRHIH